MPPARTSNAQGRSSQGVQGAVLCRCLLARATNATRSSSACTARAFASKDDLQAHLTRLEGSQASRSPRARRQLDLFSSVDDLGGTGASCSGTPRAPSSAPVLEELLRRELVRRGYEMVFTPHVAREQRWNKLRPHGGTTKRICSAAWNWEGQRYLVRPIELPLPYRHLSVASSLAIANCPSATPSLVPLPLRALGCVHGLLRVRWVHPRTTPTCFCAKTRSRKKWRPACASVWTFSRSSALPT